MRQTFSSAFQRAGAFAHLASVVRSLGGSPAARGGRARRSISTRSALTTSLPFGDCLTLLERAAEQTGCAHVGLLMGAQYRWAEHGIIHRLAQEAPTLREALQDFVGWQLGYTSGAAVYLHRVGEDFALGYGIYDRASPGSRHLYDAVVAIGCDMLRDLTGGRVTPLEVHLCHAGPEDAAVYHRILRAPVRFNQSQYCLIVSGDDIDFPRPDADPVRREQVHRARSRRELGRAGRQHLGPRAPPGAPAASARRPVHGRHGAVARPRPATPFGASSRPKARCSRRSATMSATTRRASSSPSPIFPWARSPTPSPSPATRPSARRSGAGAA